MKKLVAVLVALLMVLGVSAALAEDDENYSYQLLDDGAAMITGYNGDAKKLEIPIELDGHAVTGIGDYAFFFCNNLTSVTISDCISFIGSNPFEACNKLVDIIVSPDHPTLATIEGVLFEKTTKTLICYPCAFTAKSYTIPNGITCIGQNAFSGCERLVSVIITDSVVSIGESAFSGCERLNSITIPNSVTFIGGSAFSGCKRLTSIAIPSNITSIGKYTFFGCERLTSIIIPDSVTSIGECAFSSCPNLTLTVTRDSYAAQWCKDNGMPYTYPDANDWLNN